MLVIAKAHAFADFSDTLEVVLSRSSKHLAPFILNMHPRTTLFTRPARKYELSMLRPRDHETVICSKVTEARSDEHVVF